MTSPVWGVGTDLTTLSNSYSWGPGNSSSELWDWLPPVVWEHCGVTLPVNATNGWPYQWLGSWYPAQAGNVGQYHRTADAVVKLHTGGKARSGRENLFCLTAVAAEVTDKHSYSYSWNDGLFWYIEGVAGTVPVPPQEITVGDYGHPGSDSNLWVVLPDNTNVDVTVHVRNKDFYTFNVQQQKYKLQIVVNGINPLWPDHVPSYNNYCVGQKLNFAPAWVPPLPETPQESPTQWVFDGTFVNRKIDLYGSGYYTNEPALLKVAPTSAWWVSGGFNPPKAYTANFGEGLTFANGQYVAIAIDGKFNMYRPKLDHVTLFPYGNPEVTIKPAYLGFQYLEAGDDTVNSNGMSYWPYVISSPSFDGIAGITQIITGEFDGLEHKTPTNQLDKTEWVWEPGQQSIYSYPSPVYFSDEPHVPMPILNNTAKMNLSFVDYLRFRPNAGSADDNIFVTLQQITWKVNASATYTSGTGWQVDAGSAVTGPNFTDSIAFPFWTEVFLP